MLHRAVSASCRIHVASTWQHRLRIGEFVGIVAITELIRSDDEELPISSNSRARELIVKDVRGLKEFSGFDSHYLHLNEGPADALF